MNHEYFIRKCLNLASKGRGKVGVNPMVGSILVREDKIIAEAFHEGFGLEHAERLLLNNCEKLHSSAIGEYTYTDNVILYVNLEPCCHYGKTPPCTDFIIEKGIKKVVFGMFDPNPKVSGKGIKLLRNKGILVTGPINPEHCARFNKGFVSLQTKYRPYITIKRAQTFLGEINNSDGSPLKITSEVQDEWSHIHLRACHDAILVGVGTIIADDPQLTIRYGDMNYQPYRIILDPNMRIPLDAKVLNDELAKKTIIITKSLFEQQAQCFCDIGSCGAKKIHISFKGDRFDFNKLFKSLTTPIENFHGISSILVEGGGRTWESFEKVKDEEVVLTN